MNDPYGPWHDDGGEPYDDAPGRRSLRDLVGDLVFRYQSARLSTQVTVDVLAATVVMAIAIGVAVLLRDTGPAGVATAGPTTTSVATTVSTLPPTTTTLPPTTTTVPPTTTTVRPRPTTTTAPAPPPTEAPAPPPTAPPTTEAPYYRSCDEAVRAGVAPIPQGAPGYRRSLDRDRDGLACEADESDPWDWP
jgi:hypothetical protein